MMNLLTEIDLSVVLQPSYLIVFALTLGVIYFLKSWLSNPHHDNLPPMPCRPLPFVGHFPYLKPSPPEAFMKWQNRLGDVWSFCMGSNRLVVLSSLSALKEAFVTKADIFSERPLNFTLRVMSANDKGQLVGYSGPQWREHRNVSTSILRRFGMGKNWMAEIIDKEVEAYMKALIALKGEPTDTKILTNTALSNLICALVVGQRFEYDDKYFIRLIELLTERNRHLPAFGIIDMFWWLEYLPGDLFGAKATKRVAAEITETFCLHYINEFKDKVDDTSNDNFIKAFMREHKKKEDAGREPLDTQSFSRMIEFLFGAGTDTSSTTIQFAMVYAMHYPDTQKKVYEEIKEMIGTESTPSIEDKPKLPYLNAFIMETQRLCSVLPFSLPHMCIATTTVGGYTIPEGTIVLPYMDAVLHDEKTWGDPHTFRPERFLDKDGNVFVPEEFIPFSIGRRHCLGESLAKMELFLFFSAIFQRFEVLPDDKNNLPSMERVCGLTSSPSPFKARLIERT